MSRKHKSFIMFILVVMLIAVLMAMIELLFPVIETTMNENEPFNMICEPSTRCYQHIEAIPGV